MNNEDQFEEELESDDYFDNVPLDSDDDVEKLASEMGVIPKDDEESELDVTRVPVQSDISNSPPPEPADLEDLENKELDNAEDVTDLETEIELDR